MGTNSLVDLVVFGRRAGRHMLETIKDSDWLPLPSRNPAQPAEDEIASLLSRDKGERVADIRNRMQDIMMDNVSVVREAQGLDEAAKTIAELKDAYCHIAIDDKGKRFNTDLLEALELGCMLDCAESIIYGCIEREESRGAHYREDFQKRDDDNWLAHSMVYKEPNGDLRLEKKPITITKFEPKERTY